MKRSIAIVVLALAFSGKAFSMGDRAPRPAPSDPQWVISDVLLKIQEEPKWCWASVIQSALSARTGQTHSQCEIASRGLGRNCCRKPWNCGASPAMTTALARNGLASSLSWHFDYPAVVRELQAGRPVILGVRTAMGQAKHALFVYGTYEKNGIDYLLIFDPVFGKRRMSREQLVGDFAVHPWLFSLYLR